MLNVAETATPTRAQPKIEPIGSFELSMAQLHAVAGGIDQVLNFSARSNGAGAGKVTFNPFVIRR